MSRFTDVEVSQRDRAARVEVNLFYQGLDMISYTYSKLPESVREKVLNSGVWQVLGTVAYGVRDYVGDPHGSVNTTFNTFLGSYFIADVSERVAGKDMDEIAQARLQTGLTALQATFGAGVLATRLSTNEYDKVLADSMLLLYTGITAYVHFAYDDKKARLPPEELVALREVSNVLNSKDAIIRSKDVTIAAERQTNSDLRRDMSEQKERFGRREEELTGKLEAADKTITTQKETIDEQQIAIADLTEAKDKLSTELQEERTQHQSDLSAANIEIAELRARLLVLEQTRGAELKAVAEGLEGVSISNSSSLQS